MSLSSNDPEIIYIDESLIENKTFILSCYEAVKKLLLDNFYFFFLPEVKSPLLNKKIDAIIQTYQFTNAEDLKIFESLKNNLSQSTTSFSWGYQEVELVFIIFTQDNPEFLIEPLALIGLIIHELLHGCERQRGLEDDLKRSLAISLDTFKGFAKILSATKFKEEDLIELFKSIGETAVYVLKDLYVDREAIERGYGTEILEQYKSTFNLNDEFESTSNLPEITLDLKQIDPNNINLEEFKIAFIILLGLIPTWLSFIRISKGYQREQALELRNFIDDTYKQVSIISERFHHLENLYLTEFAFTRRFHTKWFSEIFSIVIDLLSGGQFIIWEFSKFVIDLESYIADENSKEDSTIYKLQDLILTPVLKAAFLFSKSHSKLESINKDIDDKLKKYLPEEDLAEWEESYEEYSIENLLLFVLSELIRLLREKFLDSIQNLRVYTGFVLNTLQILIDIKNDIQFLEQYHIFKNLIHQFIIDRDSRFLSLKILYPLEFEIEQMLFEDEPAFTPEQAEEFLQIARFYNLPKLNWVLEIAKRMAGIVKLSIDKAHEKNDEVDPNVVAMTMIVLTKDFEGVENKELLVPIARSILMALKINTFLMKEIVKIYGDMVIS